MSTPSVSIIIPTYNEATYVGRLLTALTKQSFRDFEVIVSDAESKDGTAKVVRDFEKQLKITLVTSPPQGPAAGKNVGAQKAAGEWLLFLDADDDIDDINFIEILLEKAAANGWATASTRLRVKDVPRWQHVGIWLNYQYIRWLAHTKHPVAPGWCILTRRDIFEHNHGFNAQIQFGEDYDYVSRVGKHGFGFVDKTYYFVDLRRGREQFSKALLNEIYRHTHHYNLEENPIKYEFGKHKERQE